MPTLFFRDDADMAQENVDAERVAEEEPQEDNMEAENVNQDEFPMEFEEEEEPIPEDHVDYAENSCNNPDHRLLLEHLAAAENHIKYLREENERLKQENRNLLRQVYSVKFKVLIK